MQAIKRKDFAGASESGAALDLRITLKYLAAFFLLTLILGELHEQVHINTGRIVCGEYGVRDFNAWRTAADCARPSLAVLATMIGPLFSYAVMWIGACLVVKAKTLDRKTIGFSLVFAPLPFARIFTAAIGGGDEKVVLKRFLEDDFSLGTIKIFAFVFVTMICLPPLLIALRNIKNRFALVYVAGFCVIPLIVLSAYILTFLNSVLASGFLAFAPFLGTPLLVIIHFSLAVVLFFFCRRWLLDLNAENNPKLQ